MQESPAGRKQGWCVFFFIYFKPANLLLIFQTGEIKFYLNILTFLSFFPVSFTSYSDRN